MCALWIETIVRKRADRADVDRKRFWQKEVLAMVIDELNLNISALAEIADDLTTNLETFGVLSTKIWDSIPAEVLQATASRRIPACYHQLYVVHALLTRYRLQMGGDADATVEGRTVTLEQLRERALGTLDLCRSAVETLTYHKRFS
jgi:hypothetical protein